MLRSYGGQRASKVGRNVSLALAAPLPSVPLAGSAWRVCTNQLGFLMGVTIVINLITIMTAIYWVSVDGVEDRHAELTLV